MSGHHFPYPSYKPDAQTFSMKDFIAGVTANRLCHFVSSDCQTYTDEKVAKAKEMLK